MDCIIASYKGLLDYPSFVERFVHIQRVLYRWYLENDH